MVSQSNAAGAGKHSKGTGASPARASAHLSIRGPRVILTWSNDPATPPLTNPQIHPIIRTYVLVTSPLQAERGGQLSPRNNDPFAQPISPRGEPYRPYLTACGYRPSANPIQTRGNALHLLGASSCKRALEPVVHALETSASGGPVGATIMPGLLIRLRSASTGMNQPGSRELKAPQPEYICSATSRAEYRSTIRERHGRGTRPNSLAKLKGLPMSQPELVLDEVGTPYRARRLTSSPLVLPPLPLRERIEVRGQKIEACPELVEG